ncbi:F-BAR domain only protein 2-like [Metopolophium dirhodum]|uniref:F-BAR domain only protein 2-like n=1 Tax=Metopolophium dirhodum TaxID=44670 RepID=UPI00298F95B9|nr:F-BAR domain only protein 2-like [Metopolophium dirhodum]
MSVSSPLLNVTASTNFNLAIHNMQSKPTAEWAFDTKTVSWKFAELAQYSESQGSGSLKARFKIDSLCPISTIVTQFNNTTLSGLKFELASSGYRVSLIKICFVAGKFPLLIIQSKYVCVLYQVQKALLNIPLCHQIVNYQFIYYIFPFIFFILFKLEYYNLKISFLLTMFFFIILVYIYYFDKIIDT